MRGTFGVLVGLVLFTIGLVGLGLALAQMMTQADPDMALKAVAGLAAYVLVCLASLAIVR
ncbi:MAG: hypothetical protein K8F92_13350 [Hyphomicrobium sp.]|uniref:hypothetical protein n=1 Tax=Hyphomicrobium sp. TaxID=82 RepID=UPI0013279B3F|nr:hypothetical protein [Hyphomicrobium sp.]KAB2943673.1 MAG: hypothetical protein F9K20_03185 [Hyphomicrobium sp.]MBZ0210627.1 hypothetical protein [Hyphomicrobium sp.]MCZ7594945.1 hypothetical protein [Hyphomicrobium sp.]